MEDGHTHLAHKAGHAVDLDKGAVLAVTLEGADQGDTTTIVPTLSETANSFARVRRDPQAGEALQPKGLAEVVADKGFSPSEVVPLAFDRYTWSEHERYGFPGPPPSIRGGVLQNGHQAYFGKEESCS